MASADGYGALASGHGGLLLNVHQELIGERTTVFFGGKGGVGKTTLASATALAAADNGAQVLVVSTDPAHNLGHLWDQQIGNDSVELYRSDSGGTVTGLEIDPVSTARQHFATVAETVVKLMPEHLHGEVRRYFDSAERSPGAHEAALLERMAQIATAPRRSEMADQGYDVMVFDTAPTGHTARLMELPGLMTAWTDGMLHRRRRSEKYAAALNALPGTEGDADPDEDRDSTIRRALEQRKLLFEKFTARLTDPAQTGFVMVTQGERMPVLETVDLYEQLSSARVEIIGAVANRRSPADQGEFLAARDRSEAEQVQWLRESLPQLPIFEVPWAPQDVRGAEALRELVAAASRH